MGFLVKGRKGELGATEESESYDTKWSSLSRDKVRALNSKNSPSHTDYTRECFSVLGRDYNGGRRLFAGNATRTPPRPKMRAIRCGRCGCRVAVQVSLVRGKIARVSTRVTKWVGR
jgi:hypothetical protein